jgi:diguanylate cyclase (GGDEF)-like protein
MNRAFIRPFIDPLLTRPVRLLPRRDWGSVLTWLLGAWLVLFIAWYGSSWGTPWRRTTITDFAYLPLTLGAVVLAVRVATSPALDRGTRRAWWLIAAAFGCQLFANAVWFWLEGIRHETPFPSLADVGFLGFIPTLLAGLLALPVRRRSNPERLKLALDIATVMAGGFMVVWYTVLGPTVAQGATGLLVGVVSVAYPVGDLVLLFGMVAMLLRGTVESSGRSLRILIVGMLSFMIADISFGYVELREGFSGGTWPDLFWLSANLAFVLAANDQRYRALLPPASDPAVRRPVQRVVLLPYLGVALGYGLLLLIARHQQLYPLGGLLLGGVVLTGVVVVRQVVALRENARLMQQYHELAITDALTGLGNRRRFLDLAERELQRTRRYGRPVAVIMIDVDHFKQINDVHGHAAGDVVLRTVVERCETALRPTDVLARYGGDELVALLPESDTSQALAVAERLREALVSVPIGIGDAAPTVTLSLGVVSSDGHVDLPTLLHRADMALYKAKGLGRNQTASYPSEPVGTPRGQPTDAFR